MGRPLRCHKKRSNRALVGVKGSTTLPVDAKSRCSGAYESGLGSGTEPAIGADKTCGAIGVLGARITAQADAVLAGEVAACVEGHDRTIGVFEALYATESASFGTGGCGDGAV